MPFDNKYTLDDYNKAIALYNRGLGSLRISKILGYKTRGAIEDWINKGRKPYYFSEKRIAVCNSNKNVERMKAMNKLTQPFASRMGADIRTKTLPEAAEQLTEDLGYILGVAYGDGHISVAQRRVMLSVTDEEFAVGFKQALEKWSGFNARLVTRQIKLPDYIKSRKLQYLAYIDSKKASEFLYNFDIKKLSNSHVSVKCAFLRGFFDSEGSVSNISLGQGLGIFCYNTNYDLIQLVTELLSSVFISSRLRIGMTHKIGNTGGDKHIYTICIRDKISIINFHSLIGFNINRKQERLVKQVDYITKSEATKMRDETKREGDDHTVFIGSKPFMKGSQ